MSQTWIRHLKPGRPSILGFLGFESLTRNLGEYLLPRGISWLRGTPADRSRELGGLGTTEAVGKAESLAGWF